MYHTDEILRCYQGTTVWGMEKESDTRRLDPRIFPSPRLLKLCKTPCAQGTLMVWRTSEPDVCMTMWLPQCHYVL